MPKFLASTFCGVLAIISLAVEAEEIVLNTASSGTMPPWSISDGNNGVTGVFKEVRDEITRLTQVKFNVKKMPVARINHSVKEGLLDIAFFPKTPFIEECCDSLGKVYDMKLGVLPLKKTKATKHEDLKGAKICVLHQSPYKFPEFELTKVNSLHQCIRMATFDRLDGVLGPRSVILYHLNKSFDLAERRKFGDFVELKTIPLHLVMNKTYKNLKVKESIKKALTNINVEQIVDRYLKPMSH